MKDRQTDNRQSRANEHAVGSPKVSVAATGKCRDKGSQVNSEDMFDDFASLYSS